MENMIDGFLAECMGFFGVLADDLGENSAFAYRQVQLDGFKVVQLRCSNDGPLSGEITRVFDPQGKPAGKLKLPWSDQRRWYRRLVVEERFAVEPVRDLFDEQSLDVFWRERMQ